MKSLTSFISLYFFVASLTAQAQIILPTYKYKQHEATTIYSYYGSLASEGVAVILLQDSLQFKFVTGVKFKLVVDSVNQGSSPTHAAFWNSGLINKAIYKNDTVLLPGSIKLFSGAIGFHLIIEGTPLIEEEKYLCELLIRLTTGLEHEIHIIANTKKTCTVSTFGGVCFPERMEAVTTYPNPFTQFTTIEWSGSTPKNRSLILYNAYGALVRKVENINTEKLILERDNLPAGIYFIELKDKQNNTAKGKLIIQ
jgi:hypothetical protein